MPLLAGLGKETLVSKPGAAVRRSSWKEEGWLASPFLSRPTASRHAAGGETRTQ